VRLKQGIGTVLRHAFGVQVLDQQIVIGFIETYVEVIYALKAAYENELLMALNKGFLGQTLGFNFELRVWRLRIKYRAI